MPKPLDNKARALNYLCNVAVDTARGIIRHIQTDFTDLRNSTHLPELIPRLQAQLAANELVLRDFVADSVYGNSLNYAFFEQQVVTP